MRSRKYTLAVLLVLCLSASWLTLSAAAAGKQLPDFFIQPYIQLGDHPGLSTPEHAVITWFTQDDKSTWKVETKVAGSTDWDSSKTTLHTHEVLDGPRSPLYHYSCDVAGLPPGQVYDYRIIKDGESIFTSWATARKAFDQPFRFTVFGDCGAGTEGQKLVAWECYKTRPDLVVIPGDIVYNNGAFSEYMSRFFPIYNNDTPEQLRGVPLLRSTTIAAVIGNHDIALGLGLPVNFHRLPDALAYYVIWEPPLNGPIKHAPDPYPSNGIANVPELAGTRADREPFLKSAGEEYPRSAIYSFDYGNSHWVALDGNQYMDWRQDRLRQWVEDDLNHSKATWKFVTFHQPGFSCDTQHATEQRMRLLADVFQRCGVDVVFTGHVHNYQRTFPLTFTPRIENGEPVINLNGTVPGDMVLDKTFDGKKQTVAHGVLYVVTGGGGAALYGMLKDCAPGIEAKENFIAKFSTSIHSFSDCKIEADKMTITQTAASGQIIDSFTVTKK